MSRYNRDLSVSTRYSEKSNNQLISIYNSYEQNILRNCQGKSKLTKFVNKSKSSMNNISKFPPNNMKNNSFVKPHNYIHKFSVNSYPQNLSLQKHGKSIIHKHAPIPEYPRHNVSDIIDRNKFNNFKKYQRNSFNPDITKSSNISRKMMNDNRIYYNNSRSLHPPIKVVFIDKG